MALISKASLLMVPSTYEPGTLYNVLPSGNRAPDSTDQNSGYDQTRADFDFDRGSNAAATRVNADGLIEKYRENLLTESNNFSDSDWIKTSVSVTGNQIGFDGNNNAWLLSATSANGNLVQNVSHSGINTLSFYAKQGSLQYAYILFNGGGFNGTAAIDLADGSIYNASAFIVDIKTTDVGNGWHRIEAVSNRANSDIRIYPSNNNSGGSSTTGSIYIQSAQLESGLIATDYLDSTDVTAKAGVLVDMPRINFDANGENGSLLLEPSRQQLITQSEYFGGWDLSNATITNNATTSPEGVDNSSLYTSSNATNYVREIITAANGTYILSAFFKRDATDNVRMNFSDSVTGEIRYVFNLTDETSTLTKSGGTISNYSADFEDYGNGWYRLHITATTNSGTSIIAYFETDNETGSFYIFGAQLEAGSYATSYIPNHGESGGVTRAADSCSVTGASDVIGQSEGVVFVEFDKKNGTGERRFFLQIGSGSTTIYARLESNNSLTTQILNGGTDYLTSTGTIIPTGKNKFAIGYANDDAVIYLNGTQLASSSSVVVPALSSLYVGSNSSNSQTIAGGISQTALFKTRLTNAELATLTTL